MLEITSKNNNYYLYVKIDNQIYRLDKENCKLEINITDGNYDMIVVATKDKNFNFSGSIKSMSLKIKPALLQLYKDKDIINHFLGWNNEKYFSVKRISVNIKSKAKIEISLSKVINFNFFDNKEVARKIEISTNGRVHIKSEDDYEFLNENQKRRYYLIQLLLLILKYLINIAIAVGNLIYSVIFVYFPGPDHFSRVPINRFTIFLEGLFVLMFLVRFIIYLIRFITVINNKNDVLTDCD